MNELENPQEEFITLQKAAELFKKTVSNISYLVQYSRISKFYRTKDENILDAKDIKSQKIRNSSTPVVSLIELIEYFEKLRKNEEEIIRQIPNCNKDLLFFNIPERERTKHVHRFHPYMGKFIPQLVEYYLDKYFQEENLILDPFAGSGTTLIECNVKNIKSIGLDISYFNCLITQVKMQIYDTKKLKIEMDDILDKTIEEDKRIKNQKEVIQTHQKRIDHFITSDKNIIVKNQYKTENKYLNKWFAQNTLKQMLIYSSLIPNYKYQNLLRVLLSRSIRSARLTFHFELTRLKQPIYEPYVCHKHRHKVCAPTQSLIPFLKRYSKDTLRRITEFSKIRSDQPYIILNTDSSEIDLTKTLEKNFQGQKIDAIITSPPYVGLINYHKQHKYAYELLGIEKNIEKEIGRRELGTGKAAREKYRDEIAKVFKNLKRFLKDDAIAFIVANDKWNLYPEIADLAGYKIIDCDERPVTKKASRERSFYSETIFHFKPL